MTASQILVGVDGGGTGCRAAVGTAERGIVARADGGPANIQTNSDGAIANIRQTVSQALAAAGWQDAPSQNICAAIGVAGGNGQDLNRLIRPALSYGTVHVTGDRQTTVTGVLGPADGFVIALGTGTIVARQKALDVRTVGGWGFQVSDQASGSWLGRRLLEATVLAEDGVADHSPLTRATARKQGGNLQTFLFATQAKPGDFATFAPAVVAAAEEGEPFAVSLMQEGARYLQHALAALGFATGDRLCLSGGLGPRYLPFLPVAMTAHVTPPEGTALDGAFALARRAAEGALTDEV